MSLSAARSFLSEAAYGEQELDANSALMELDKGARVFVYVCVFIGSFNACIMHRLLINGAIV